MALDISALGNLVTMSANELMIEEYAQVPPIWNQITGTRVISAESGNLYGESREIFDSAGELIERDDYIPFKADNPRPIGTAYAKTRPFGRSLVVAERTLAQLNRGPNAQVQLNIRNYVEEQLGGFARRAARQRDRWLAASLEAGTLTAGSLPYFDNSFPKHPDTNPGFLYDGKPWFATDHALRSGVQVSNRFAAKPLNATNLEEGVTHFRTAMAVNHRGMEIDNEPTALIVHPGLGPTARRLVDSVLEPEGSTNAINAMQGRLRVIELRNLTNSGGWFLANAQYGTQMGTDGPPRMKSQPKIEDDTLTFTIQMHLSLMVWDWRSACAFNYAGS
jgi:hypothetical protein